MVYRLRPLEVSFDFEDRPYQLGESIDLTVEVNSEHEVKVRAGTLELVLEERLVEAQMGRQMGMGGAGALQGGDFLKTTDYVPMQQTTTEKSDTYVHSSAEFLGQSTLTPDTPNSYRTSLRIEPTLPKRLHEAGERQKDANSSISFHWKLAVWVDVVGGRNPRIERAITVVAE